MDDIYDVANMTDEEAQSEAYKLGWRSQEEFNGDPEKFTDAKTFLSKANGNIPMLRENYRKIEASNRRLQEQLDKLSQQMEQANKRYEEAEAKGYEAAIRDIEYKQRKAVEDGDVTRWDELQKQKTELKPVKHERPAQQPQNNSGLMQADQVAIAVFESNNPWLRTDQDLNEDMRGFLLAERGKNPDLPMVDALERAKQRVIKANPDKFREMPRSNAVLSSSGATSSKLSYATLPAEEKAVFDREWAHMEQDMKLRGMSAEQIEKSKKSYQSYALEAHSK